MSLKNKTSKSYFSNRKNIKYLWSLLCGVLCTLAFPLPALADEGGNPITNSELFQGIQRMLYDAGMALMIITPILGALLIGIFSILGAIQSEAHEKEKWAKNRKVTIIAVIIVFGASSIMTIISSYLG